MDPKFFPRHRLAELVNEFRRKNDPSCPLINPEDIPDYVVDKVLELGESIIAEQKEGKLPQQKLN